MCLFCTIACGVWETLTGLQFRVIEFFVVAFTEFLLIVEFQAGYRGVSKGGKGEGASASPLFGKILFQISMLGFIQMNLLVIVKTVWKG